MYRFSRTMVSILAVCALLTLSACQTARRSSPISSQQTAPVVSRNPAPVQPAPVQQASPLSLAPSPASSQQAAPVASSNPAPVQPAAQVARKPSQTARKSSPASSPQAAPVTPSNPAPVQRAAPAAPAAPVAGEAIEFHLAQTQPGGSDTTALNLKDGTIYAQNQPVLTRADLREALHLTNGQNNFVGLQFSDEGASKLDKLSRQNIGKLLIVIVGRELVGVLRITEPMNRGVVAFPMSSSDVDRILARIRGQ